MAEGQRDAFLQAALGFIGTPFLSRSSDPEKGLDGAGLIGLALRRTELLPRDAKALTARALNGLLPFLGGTREEIPAQIVPGDIAWFGSGTHDLEAQQHPMIYLGDGRALGPVPSGGPRGSAVQILELAQFPGTFAGWSHFDDFGAEHTEGEVPLPPPDAPVFASAALLPANGADRYEALAALARARKARWSKEPGHVNLVGVTNLVERCRVLPREGAWNDTLFAAWLDEDGHRRCLALRASLNPGTDRSRAESWQLAEGSFEFALAGAGGAETLRPEPGNPVAGWFDRTGVGFRRADEPDDSVQGESYDDVPVELVPGGVAELARANKGAQMVWGGDGSRSPWGLLTALIRQGGGRCSYTYLDATALLERKLKPEGAPGEAPLTGTDLRPREPEEGQPRKLEPAPNAAAPGLDHVDGPAGTGRLFNAGLNVGYQGEPARIWAHPRAANSGPRPVIIYLHDLNPEGLPHPALSPDVGMADFPWLHLGKLAHALIDAGKVTPLAMIAPTHTSSAPWDSLDLEELLNAAEARFKESGVELDLDQVALVAHGGAGGYAGRGLEKIIEGGARLGSHPLRLLGLADTRTTASAAAGYQRGLAGNTTTAIYAMHRHTGGWHSGEYLEEGGSESFAKALGAVRRNTSQVVGDEELASVEEYWDSGDSKPLRVSLKVQPLMERFVERWRASGGYGDADLGSHDDLLARWTWWALPRFFPQSAADQALLASGTPADEPLAPVAPPPPPVLSGGEFNIPPAAKPWVNPAGELQPRPFEGFDFAPATGLYYPVRAASLPEGRGVYYLGVDGASYGPKGRGGGGASFFLAERGSGGRKHLGIDVAVHAAGAMVVAAESGAVVAISEASPEAWSVFVQGESGLVLRYGELDGRALKEARIAKGARVQAGQPLGRLRLEADARLLFEIHRSGTLAPCVYAPGDATAAAQNEQARKAVYNPTVHLLALAKSGR